MKEGRPVSKTIRNEMEKRGYYFDDLESSRGYYRFIYPNMIFPLVFSSVKEIHSWLNETNY